MAEQSPGANPYNTCWHECNSLAAYMKRRRFHSKWETRVGIFVQMEQAGLKYDARCPGPDEAKACTSALRDFLESKPTPKPKS